MVHKKKEKQNQIHIKPFDMAFNMLAWFVFINFYCWAINNAHITDITPKY